MRLRATTKIRNDSIIEARKSIGLSQIKLAKFLGIGLNFITALEKLDFSNKNAMKHAEMVADFLELDINDVLPKELRGKFIESDILRKADVEPDRLLGLVEDRRFLPQPDEIYTNDIGKKIEKAFDKLSSREREILKMRYGFYDGKVRTRVEISKKLNISTQRISQIEERALVRMKHPVRLGKMNSDDE